MLSIWSSLKFWCLAMSLSLSLNIFILHRLRNKFLQFILISLDSASWELHQYSRRMCGPMKNPKVQTRSWDLMIARPTLYITTTDTTMNLLFTKDVIKLKAIADDKIKAAKMRILSLIEQKTLWEKEKMLVTSIFSFSHSVYQSLIS